MQAPSPLATDPAQDLGCDAVVVGGGPAGLMAAEVLAQGGVAVHVFDAMPSVGRKFFFAEAGGETSSGWFSDGCVGSICFGDSICLSVSV